MGSGLVRNKYAHKLNYSLKRRFFDKDDKPLAWQDIGQGFLGEYDGRVVCDYKTVQKQIDKLVRINRKVEIEFIHDKTKKDYYGYPTKKEQLFNLGTEAP